MSIFTIGFHEEREDGTCYANPTILYHIHIYHTHILYYLYYTILYHIHIVSILYHPTKNSSLIEFDFLRYLIFTGFKVIDFLKLSNS